MIRMLIILLFALGAGCSQTSNGEHSTDSSAPVTPSDNGDLGSMESDSSMSLDAGGELQDAGGESLDVVGESQDASSDVMETPPDVGPDAGEADDVIPDEGRVDAGGFEMDGGGPDTASEEREGEIPSALTAVLDDIPGWGAGTIGGRDGTLYTVTGLHDDGPGSLRDALESPEPLWVVFAEGLNGVIQMEGSISVASYKTIDARGHDITLRATEAWEGGLRIGDPNQPGVEHVVILNLKFDGQWPNYTEDDEGDDGINIRNGSHHVWIHHCSFNNWIDGAIDAKVDAGFPLPHHVTISKSFFTRTHQPLAVAIDYLTFARNHCLDVTKRCIQLNDGAHGHMVNNVVEDWRAASIVASRDGSQLLVDNNLFKPGRDCDVVGAQLREDTDEYGQLQNENNHWRLTWGWVAFRNFTWVDGDFFASTRMAYPPATCGVFEVECWDALFAEVVDEAGAQP